MQLKDVAIGDETDELSALIYYRQLFDLKFLQDLFCFLEVSTFRCGDQVFAGHHFPYFLTWASFKSQVTIGKYSYQFIFCIHNGNAADLVFFHQPQCVPNGGIFTKGHGVKDQSAFRSFDLAHLFGLALYRHILMQYAHTALPCEGNSQ